MTDAEFLAALESCVLPEAEFDHRGHLRAAWLCLRGGSFPEALARMSAALKRYSTHMGKPDRYHETITVAYMAVINERLHADGAQDSWSAFLRDNPDLGDRRLLTHYYRPETLASATARDVFILGEYREQPFAVGDSADSGHAAGAFAPARERAVEILPAPSRSRFTSYV